LGAGASALTPAHCTMQMTGLHNAAQAPVI